MALAAAVNVANEGAKLFAAGDFVSALERFSAALDGLPPFDPVAGDARSDDAAQAALSRARALNNRAACHLRLGAPLRALDDSADAMALLCDPGRAAAGVPAVRRGCSGFAADARSVILSSVLKRASAYEAAGTPVGAQPLAVWGAAQAGPSAAKLREVAARLCRSELSPASPAGGALPAGVVPACGALLPLALRAGCPPERRCGVGAAVGGHLYILGGVRDDFSEEKQFWRLPLRKPAAGPWDWERLPSPGGPSGGPEYTRSVLLAAAPATNELLCLSYAKLWALPVGGPPAAMTWRDLGHPWSLDDDNEISGAALTAVDDAAIVYAPEYGVVSVCLRTGSRKQLWTPPPRDESTAWMAGPIASAPHMWPAGEDALLLYGGGAPDVRGATELEGHLLISPPPVGDMWRLQLATGAWSRVARGGGGAPPPPRAEAAMTPLLGGSFEAGSAVLLGGYSELLPQSGGPRMPGTAYRYCDDAYIFTPAAGWRRLAATGPRMAPAASVACGFQAEEGGSGGAVCFCGGYTGFEGMHSHAQVTSLRITPAAVQGGPASPETPGPARDQALLRAALRLLTVRGLPNQMPPLPLPDMSSIGVRYETRRHEGADWAALVAAAAALPRGAPASQAVVTWQETRPADDERVPPMFQLSVSRSELQPRDGDAVSTDFFFGVPDAGDVARLLLLSLVPPPGARQLPRPRSVLFAARLGGDVMRACGPLLELLHLAPTLESWAAAAESALMHDTNPWGYNAVRRCVACKRAADGGRAGDAPNAPRQQKLKLRACGACGVASYCGAECQKADWANHKELCRFAKTYKEAHGMK